MILSKVANCLIAEAAPSESFLAHFEAAGPPLDTERLDERWRPHRPRDRRAYLCSLYPTLIAMPDVDSLLHLAGHGARAARPRQAIKTIGLAEASDWVKHVLPSYPQQGKAKDDRLVASRNGIAHAALWEDAEVRDVLVLAVRRIDALLNALGEERAAFWESNAELTARLVDDAVQDAELRVQSKLQAAREEYAARYQPLAEDVRRSATAVLSARPSFEADHVEPTRCPGSGDQAWIGGPFETRFDLQFMDTPYGETSVPTVMFYPGMLACTVCGLELVGDGLRYVGIDDMIELPEAEPDIPEPGEDWIREYLAYRDDEP